jgi:ABC-type thiamine transport system ATPase subunit
MGDSSGVSWRRPIAIKQACYARLRTWTYITTGRIFQAGVEVFALTPAERDFSIVFQSYALFANIECGKERRLWAGKTSCGARLDSTASARTACHLGRPADQGDKHPSQLLGGQCRFARPGCTLAHLSAVIALRQMDAEFESITASLKAPLYIKLLVCDCAGVPACHPGHHHLRVH